MNYRTRILCCQLHAWPAPEGLVQTTKLFGKRERGRGSRKENENKPYPHPVRTLPFPDQQRQIPAGQSRFKFRCQAKSTWNGTWRGGEWLPEPRHQLGWPELIVQKPKVYGTWHVARDPRRPGQLPAGLQR